MHDKSMPVECPEPFVKIYYIDVTKPKISHSLKCLKKLSRNAVRTLKEQGWVIAGQVDIND